jgi:CheY-like chemotaxis protein/DNA-binding MarR family transcriptional regulator
MNKKILIIEDDNIVRENTADLLRFSNYDVVTAKNGRTGVNKAQEELPDVILCDILMPKLDGYAVYDILSTDKRTSRIPFIFLTSKTARADFRKAMELGADDYITKPFNESELLNAVKCRINKLKKFNFNSTNEVNKKKVLIKDNLQFKDILERFLERETYHYKKGDMLFCEGNRNKHIFLIKKGYVKGFKLTEDGKELITGLYQDKMFIGHISVLGNFGNTENAQVIDDTLLVKIEKEEMKSIIKDNPEFVIKLTELLAENIKISRDKLLHVAYDTVRGRTAQSLLILSINEPLSIIKLSRANLASIIGIAKETLIRTLNEFKKEGLINTGRDFVQILSREKLQHTH